MFTKQTISQLAAASLLLCTTGFASAQATGTVRGSVTDHFGGLVPQAEVTLSDAAGHSRKIESGDDGKFEIAGLANGHYVVTIKAQGLVTASDDDVIVDGSKVTVDNFVLDIAEDAMEQVNASL